MKRLPDGYTLPNVNRILPDGSREKVLCICSHWSTDLLDGEWVKSVDCTEPARWQAVVVDEDGEDRTLEACEGHRRWLAEQEAASK